MSCRGQSTSYLRLLRIPTVPLTHPLALGDYFWDRECSVATILGPFLLFTLERRTYRLLQ